MSADDLMISSKTLPMIIIFITALLLVISNTNSTAVNACMIISPWCQNATSNKALCSVITKNATSWPEAMTNALSYELDYVNAGQSVVDSDIVSELTRNIRDPELARKITSSCSQANQQVVGDLNSCLGWVKGFTAINSVPDVIRKQNFDGCTKYLDGDDILMPSSLQNYMDMFFKSNGILLVLASAGVAAYS